MGFNGKCKCCHLVEMKEGPTAKTVLFSEMAEYKLGNVEDVDNAEDCCYECAKSGFSSTNEGHYRASKNKCSCMDIRKHCLVNQLIFCDL